MKPPPDKAASTQTPAQPAPYTDVASTLRQILAPPAFEQAPAFTVAAVSPYQSSTVGNGRPTYLSAVYGQIMGRLHRPPHLGGDHGKGLGEVVFEVDGRGRLMRKSLVRSSGDPALDFAVLNAVAEASPYPTPPTNAPVGLKFTFNAK